MDRLGSPLATLGMLAALFGPIDAAATAQIGGVIGATFAPGSGNCNQTAQVPLATFQDTFALNLNAPCLGPGVTGSLRGDAATGSIALRVSASTIGFASAQVSLVDFWFLTPPAGTPAGTYTIPTKLHIDGTAGGVASLGTYLSYSLTLIDFSSPGSRIDGIGSVVAPGLVLQDFAAPLSVSVNTASGSLRGTLQVSLQMSVPQLNAGTIDFHNTAFAALALPPGWTAVTSSGLLVTSVPEPASGLLMLLGTGVLVRWSRRRR